MDQAEAELVVPLVNTHVSDMQVDAPAEPGASTAAVPPISSAPQLPAKTVGYVWSIEMLNHACVFDEGEDDEDSRHPEQPERLVRIHQTLEQAGCLARMRQLPIRPVTEQEAMLVHTDTHWEKVMAIKDFSEQQIIDSRAYYEQLSLYVNNATTDAALLSCGGVVETCLAVARGELQKAFAIVRPPGHHAEPEEHMGFCFFNNVAVATRVLQAVTGIRKIMILDWDVHHGNGTQAAFYDDPDVLYVSLHRYDSGQFYPMGPAGSMHSVGEGAGEGFSLNVPWPQKGAGDAEYLHAFQRLIMPIAMEFSPELVIISAGFDAARGDQLGGGDVTPDGYAHMTHMLAGLAGGKLVVALEGGYNLDAIAQSALAVTRVLLGEAPPRMPPMTAQAWATRTVWEVARVQKQFWNSLDVAACEPYGEQYEAITVGIAEILMAHRQDYLARHHLMSQIPLATSIFQNVLAAEAWCTSDIFNKETLVVLVHEFGELRGEPMSSVTIDLHQEKTYLIDFSRELIRWISEEKYALIDVNLTEKLPKTPGGSRRQQELNAPDNLKRGVLTYLWDNYIHLSAAKDVIFVGHGAGCAPIIDLLAARPASIMQKVRHVIQVAPRSTIPRAPQNPTNMRMWYFKHSTVFVPASHPTLLEGKTKPSHGRIAQIDEDKPILLLKKAMPSIKTQIKAGLEEQEEAEENDASTNGAAA